MSDVNTDDVSTTDVNTSDEALTQANILEWNIRIIEEFRANEGRVGGRFEGAPMILVHHVGARSGTERVSPLVMFPQSDGRFVIVAAKGGAPTHPDWYHNLKANPGIRVEVGTETFAAQVEELTGAERDEVWTAVKATAPQFAEYEQQTTRTIPLLALTRT